MVQITRLILQHELDFDLASPPRRDLLAVDSHATATRLEVDHLE
jgi:hypothetical protein